MRISGFVCAAAGLGAAVALVAVAGNASASGTDSKTMQVTADVTKVCTITATPVGFGSYDVYSASDLQKSGSVAVACTKNTVATIELNGGQRGNHTMLGPGGDVLTYSVKQPDNATPWGSGNGAVSYSSQGKASQPLTINAVVPKGQDVAAGAYSDDVTATINF